MAEAERVDRLTDAAVVGVAGVLLPALLLFAAYRRDRGRLAAKSKMFR